MICERISRFEPSHYYITANYEVQMEDHMYFEYGHRDFRFQMLMKTKWLLEYIAEQTMQRQRLKPEARHTLDEFIPSTYGESLDLITQ